MAVWVWAAAAMVAVLGIETAIAVGAFGGAGIEAVRFAAAAATFCPVVALLGAKRPQDRAWQLIVLSFWVILALPAAQAWLQPGQVLIVHPIWSWFLVVLIVVGASNYLPTRNAIAALLAAAGQAILVWRELPWVGGAAETSVPARPIGCRSPASRYWPPRRRWRRAAGRDRAWRENRSSGYRAISAISSAWCGVCALPSA